MDFSIKAEIVRRGMTYKEVAEKAGIPARSFYRRCKNNSFTMEEVGRILDVLGLKLTLEE